MRRRFCRISCSSPRVRMRPGRWSRASVSREAQRRRNGSSHQASPKSSSPVVATAAAVRSSGWSETTERPSSPRPRPSETILSAHGLRGGGAQGTGRHRTRHGGEWSMRIGVECGVAADERARARSRRGRDRRACWPPGADHPLGPGRPRLAARPRPADGGAAGAPPSRRRRAGGGRAGARHRPPAARGHRRDPRHRRGGRGPAGAGGAGGRDGGAARGGEAVSRGDRGRLRRGADQPTAWSRWAARAAP